MHCEYAFEKLRLFVPQHHREDVIVDDFFYALGDTAKQFFAIENGSEFAAYVVKQAKRFRLLRKSGKQRLRNGISFPLRRKSRELRKLVHGR